MSERAAGVSAERKRRDRPLEKERRKRRDRMERVGLRGLRGLRGLQYRTSGTVELAPLKQEKISRV
jgi:hypothetical protein